MKSKFKTTIIIIVLVLALVACAFLLGRKSMQKSQNIDLIVTDFGFKDIGELSTAEFVFTMVEEYTGDPVKVFDITLPFTTPKLTYSVEGSVKAGINFASIEVQTVGNQITLLMPLAHLTGVNVDMSSLKVFEETKGIFNSVKVKDTASAVLELEAKAKNLAIEKGLITKAQENANTMVKEMVEEVVGSDYEVIVKWSSIN